jgi:hypothetical protein
MKTKTVIGTVIEVRPEDGAQCIRYGQGLCDVSWLCGIDRVSGLKVGDVGTLYYESDGKTYGRDVFVPNDQSESEIKSYTVDIPGDIQKLNAQPPLAEPACSPTGPSYCAVCGEWPAHQTPHGLRCNLCDDREWAAAHPVPLPNNPEMLRDLAIIGVSGAAEKLAND